MITESMSLLSAKKLEEERKSVIKEMNESI